MMNAFFQLSSVFTVYQHTLARTLQLAEHNGLLYSSTGIYANFD